MGQTHQSDVERQTASKGGGASGWGKHLFSVETDRKRVGLEALIRLGASLLAVALAWSRNGGLSLALGAVLAVLCAWPLLHMGDHMELYQNGVVYQGKLYPIAPGVSVSWTGGRGFFLPTTWLSINGCLGRIDVSFMKDAQKLFNRAYHNAIYYKGE